MRSWMRLSFLVGATGFMVVLALGSRSEAFHFFRGNGTGGCSTGSDPATNPPCCPRTGNFTDDPGGVSGPVAATVDVLHNSFNHEVTKLPVVRISAGKAVQWRWASSHCHSVTSDDGKFHSGFFYPTNPPAGQSVAIMNFLEYPVPDPNPSLTYTHTFNAPGTYPYRCIHHQIIGMEGVVIVE